MAGAAGWHRSRTVEAFTVPAAQPALPIDELALALAAEFRQTADPSALAQPASSARS